MLRISMLSAIATVGLVLGSITPTYAFVEDTAPTFENGSVDPALTADPPSVAAAQRVLARFFEYTNRNYSRAGFANPREMREQLGNRQGNWLDKAMPLACGRLVGGYKGRNWIPGKGWAHDAPSGSHASASVPCLYRPPTAGDGGPDPRETLDPPAVAAAQQALADFYRFTNDNYSIRGFASPQLMRERQGNASGRWLDQALALARGELTCGFRCMNWIPNKGWSHEAPPAASTGSGQGSASARQQDRDAWSPEMRSIIGGTGPILAPQSIVRTTEPVLFDPTVDDIIASLPLPVDGRP